MRDVIGVWHLTVWIADLDDRPLAGRIESTADTAGPAADVAYVADVDAACDHLRSFLEQFRPR